MKKIMFFCPMYYIGGTEIAVLSLIKKLKGFDIYIGYTDDTSSKELLESYSKFAKVIKVDENFNENIDTLILCSSHKTVLDIDKKIVRNKTILWFHYFGKKETSIFTDDRCYEIIDSIVTVSETTKKMMLQQEYANKIKCEIKVIYNIVDVQDILEKSNEKVDIDTSHELNLVSVGRLCYDKGFERQIELARLLKKHNIDFKWYIVGGNYYEDIELEIKNKYQELKENFVLMGFLNNPYSIIKKCDYLVLLSSKETWGLVITEAKILGVPCIVTDFEVAYEQILDNYTGIILSREDTSSYENKIDLILNNKFLYKENLKEFKWSNDLSLEEWTKILS